MNEPEPLDTWYTDNVVCPWCGHEYEDGSEFFDGVRDTALGHECTECGEQFDVEREFDVHYTTSKPRRIGGALQ
jgi:DNA-directed RNA polymerase subunit RPC12/RpoP